MAPQSEVLASGNGSASDPLKRVLLVAELLILFVGWPLLAFFLEGWAKFVIFAIPLLYAAIVYVRLRPRRPPARWLWQVPIIRFVAALPVLAAITLFLTPQGWLAFPRERPFLWAVVMVLYPFFSALPQEFLYRRYFFWRYDGLVGEGPHRLLINALLFGWLHVMYENWPAVVLSTVGGLFFAATYAHTRNLALVWLEHTVYGQAIFTLGLGRFFYTGAT